MRRMERDCRGLGGRDLSRRAGATDDEIDQLVYELYELAVEDIAVVEEPGRK